MYNFKFDVMKMAGFIFSITLPIVSRAYSSAEEINAFLDKNKCAIEAYDSENQLHKRELNDEVSQKDSDGSTLGFRTKAFVENLQADDTRSKYGHLVIPPSGKPFQEEIYIYFDLNKNSTLAEGYLTSDIYFNVTSSFVSWLPVKYLNLVTSNKFRIPFVLNNNQKYFLNCIPNIK